MSYKLSTYNTIYKILNKHTNSILYQPSNTVFDLIIRDIEDLTIENNNPNLYNQYYDAYMTSNVLEHSSARNNTVYEYGIPDIMSFHKLVPEKFKKEDLYIFKQASSRSYKLLFHNLIRDSWTIKDKLTYNINYGIPKCVVADHIHRKSVVFLNTQKSHNLDNLFEYIHNTFKDALIIRDMNNFTYEEFVNTLSEYQLCIEHDTIINSVVASYAGCKVITSLPQIEYVNGYFNISDYSNIIELIGSLINQNTIIMNRDELQLYYSFDKFIDQFSKCIKDLKRASVSP